MHHLRRPPALLLSLAVVVSLVGFTVTTALAKPSPNHASNKPEVNLVMTALQVVFNDHEIDQIDKYFSADFVQHSPLISDPGREGLKRWLTRTLDSIPDLRYSPEQVLVDHDRVIVIATVTGTIEQDMPEYGIKANDQALNISTAHIFRVRHHQIVEHWEVVDTGQLVQIASESPLE